jgi:hypothetical protein
VCGEVWLDGASGWEGGEVALVLDVAETPFKSVHNKSIGQM